MLVIASKPGQLGNRLLQFAQFVACAAEHGLSVANPAFDDYADYFEATSRDLFCRFPARRAPLGGGPAARKLLYRLCYYAARALARGGVRGGPVHAVHLDWAERLDLDDPAFLASVKPRRLVLMQGWQFTARASVARRATEVREFFRPLKAFRDNVDALVRRARAGADVLVGVHIRHGDYRTFQGGKYFYELDVYADLMRRAEALFPGRRVRFLVCSNAEHDADAFAAFGYERGTGHLVEDLYALAACDYLVGPPSTFGMWASFYGETPAYLVQDPRRPLSLESFGVYDLVSARSDEPPPSHEDGPPPGEAAPAPSAAPGQPRD